MKRGWTRMAGWSLAVGALVAVAWPAPTSAQQTPDRDVECRCVDRDGVAIDDCTCFRAPRLEAFMAPLGARPRLGISVESDQGGTYDAQGARIASILEEGPAAEAGLRRGDVITRIDGRSLLEPLAADVEARFDLDESLPVQRLLSVARGLEPGQQVQIEYLREGERRTATVEAREISSGSFAWSFDPDQMRVDTERIREQVREMREGLRDLDIRIDGPRGDREVRVFGGGGPALFGPLGSTRYGIQLIELNEQLGTYFGATEGVLVTEVDEDSTLGLRAGDVILRVGERDVRTPDRVLRLLGTYERDEEIPLRIIRNGSEMSLTGRISR